MRTRSRRIHWSTRRLLLATCIGGLAGISSSASCLGAETPTNQFRIVNPPAKSSAVGQVQLASDGWELRQSNDSIPAVHKQPASDSTTTSSLDLNEPKSTLNFIMPSMQHEVEQPASPAKPASKPLANEKREPQSSARLASELYGPGSQTVKNTKQRISDESPALKPVDSAVSNPEQNEPAIGASDVDAQVPDDIADLNEIDAGNPDDSNIVDGQMELEPYGDEPDAAPQRLEVRDLKLHSDGTLDEQAGSSKSQRNLAADPISSRRSESARQSITDGEEPEVADQSEHARDSINAAGELKLSLGLPDQIAISATAARLRAPIERTLSYYWARPENSAERTHWGMFHQMMIFDKDTQIIYQKQQYNAVAWMAGNNPCRNQLLYDRDEHGIVVKEGIGLQGHQAQMLAIFGLIDVPANYPIYVSKHRFSVQDVIQREMKSCKSGAELTFALIGLSHYIDTDRKWTSFDGETWSFDRLIQEELAQPIVGAACGGTHRLMGFAHALRRRRAEGKPITGQWARADKYVRDFIAYTWQLQNRDGSMSTAWFEKQEDNGKIDRKVQTTGHMVEFLVTALDDDELQSPPMLRSISFLTNSFWEERGHDWQVGPKGHALRALALFYQRVYGRPDPWRTQSIASRSSKSSR